MPPVKIAPMLPSLDIPESLRKQIAQAMAAMPASGIPLAYYCVRDGHRVHHFDDGYQCRICGKKFTEVTASPVSAPPG